jgi:hypothetical protein
MEILGGVLTVIGTGASAAGFIWLLVKAFQESVGWGVACLLLPFVSIFFVFMHWPEAKRPFMVSMAGLGLQLIGMSIFQAQ